MIFIASDHGGYELKNKIVNYLDDGGIKITDIGPFKLQPGDDYPDFVNPLINKVLSAQGSMGILICKNGVGVCMMANKFKGIRAGLSWNIKHAVSSRNDDNTNILCLPADYIFEEEALKTVEAWLNTPFSKEERFSRRLKKAGL
jgi:RpiB/LacA/LacB family sugar-phosphate isomerase